MSEQIVLPARCQVLLVILANPALLNWWHIWGITLPPETDLVRVNAAVRRAHVRGGLQAGTASSALR